MQKKSNLSASAGQLYDSPHPVVTVSNPSSVPTPPLDDDTTCIATSSSDLGSDAEWQCRDGRVSDEDALDPQPDSQSAFMPSTVDQDDDTFPAFKWHNTDEEAFVEDVSNVPVPVPSPSTSSQQQPIDLSTTHTNFNIDNNYNDSTDDSNTANQSYHLLSSSAPSQHQHQSSLSSPHFPRYSVPTDVPHNHTPPPPPSFDYIVERHNAALSSAPIQSQPAAVAAAAVAAAASSHPSDALSIPAGTIAATNNSSNDVYSIETNHAHNLNRNHVEVNGSDEDGDDEHDADEYGDQFAIIRGYRGVSSRAAISSSTTPVDNTSHRLHGWADRPRGHSGQSSTNQQTSQPQSHAHTHVHAQQQPQYIPPDSSSGQSSPARSRLHHVGSDSGVSSQGGSIGSGSALRLSARTSSSAASDISRRTASKSITFLPGSSDLQQRSIQLDDFNNSTNLIDDGSGSSQLERKVSILRVSGTADLQNRNPSQQAEQDHEYHHQYTHHQPSHPQHPHHHHHHHHPQQQQYQSRMTQRGSLFDHSSSQQHHTQTHDMGSDLSMSPPKGDMDHLPTNMSALNMIHNTIHGRPNMGVARSASNSVASNASIQQRLSSKSDAGVYDRQASELSSSSARGADHYRPISSPLRLHPDEQQSHVQQQAPYGPYDYGFQREEGLMDTDAGSVHGAGIPNPASQNISAPRPGFMAMNRIGGGFGKRSSNTKPMALAVKDMSFLECVVEILKGTTVLRKRNFMQASDAAVWLTSDLRRLQFKVISKKPTTPLIQTIELSDVRRLKGGSDRGLIIEATGIKKALDLVFQSRERAEIWLSGLSCLVPSNAIIKAKEKDHQMQARRSYDPLKDSWGGKPLSARKRLSEFILLGSIGRGSFGKVKLAISSHDLQFYGVKVISKTMMRKRIQTASFDRVQASMPTSSNLTLDDVREVAVLRELNHANVMGLKTAYDDPTRDSIFIVVEYLAKGPIMNSSKLDGAIPLPEDRARTAFVDVLCGLEYLHRNSVVHRDIKPDNLLEAGDGTVKISDFGSALRYQEHESDRSNNGEDEDDDERNRGTAVGTPAFTAPELCWSDKAPPCPTRCYAADIWSLGASLFYMLYGRAPYTARTMFEMYEAICTQPLNFPETPVVSKHAQHLLKIMLEKSPKKRANFDTIMRTEWLKDFADVAEKLSELRIALFSRGDATSTPQQLSQHATVPSQNGRFPQSKSLGSVNDTRLRAHR